MNQVTWMTRNEGIETNELKWMNCQEWIEMKQLFRTNWAEWMKSQNWHAWIDMNELKRMHWNEWLDMNEVKWMTLKEWNCQKCSENLSFFYDFYVKPSSLYSLVHILSITFRIEARPRTATLPEKNQGFCARECFQPWIIHAFPIAHTSQLLDDNCLIMMWLTWWWGWHDDWDDDVLAMMVRQLAIDNCS